MGVLLENLTWIEAESVLTPEAIIVIALGAAAKEHGPHLRLNNDWVMAEYLKNAVSSLDGIVILPTVAYHHYPAFVEYPGSVSLSVATAKNLLLDICRSIAAFGPRKFYVINTGISTVRALMPASEILLAEGIVMDYTDLHRALSTVSAQIMAQEGGSHADELETSMMLFMDETRVDMSKAVKDYNSGDGPLTRDDTNAGGTYSPSGVWGDATLATRAKGEKLVAALLEAITADIAAMRISRTR